MFIHGKSILGFPYDEKEIKQYFGDFDICENNHEFEIKIYSYPQKYIMKLLEENRFIHKEYLFCFDENGKAFTLYECFIAPINFSIMKIIWNKCIYGYHIDNIQINNINSAEYILQTKIIYPIYSLINEGLDIMNGSVHIKTKKNKRNIVKENKIEILYIFSDKSIKIDIMERIILRLLEIYFLQVGFCPKIEKCKMITDDKKEFYFIEDFTLYRKTTKRNMESDYLLKAKTNLNFSIIYDKWWKLREKEAVTFNIFSYLTIQNSPIKELPIATYIQCLEGYFRVHHKEDLFRFSEDTKKQIKEEVFKLMDSSDNLKKICENNNIKLKDIEDIFKRMSGNINQYSLNDILKYAIERCKYSKYLFKYEMMTKKSNGKTLIDIFIQKASGHRNWLSHVMKQKKYFINKEINLANDKLRLLFRLNLLYDIGIEVTDESLEYAVTSINNWYINNELK